MREPIIEVNGKEYFDHEAALAILLGEGRLFCNSRVYLEENGDKADETVVLFVNCNDLFAWGCADAESLTRDEIEEVYKAWKADPSWGIDKWCCRKRRQQPQDPVIEQMKEAGVWDEDMEKLPKNFDDRVVHAMVAEAIGKFKGKPSEEP